MDFIGGLFISIGRLVQIVGGIIYSLWCLSILSNAGFWGFFGWLLFPIVAPIIEITHGRWELAGLGVLVFVVSIVCYLTGSLLGGSCD